MKHTTELNKAQKAYARACVNLEYAQDREGAAAKRLARARFAHAVAVAEAVAAAVAPGTAEKVAI